MHLVNNIRTLQSVEIVLLNELDKVKTKTKKTVVNGSLKTLECKWWSLFQTVLHYMCSNPSWNVEIRDNTARVFSRPRTIESREGFRNLFT